MGKAVTEHFQLAGNQQYGISEDQGKSAIYTVKDGCFVYKGYSPEEIASLQSQSTTKIKFKDLIKNLREEFVNQQIDFQSYINSYITIHVDHTKPLSDFRLKSHFQSIYLLRNPEQITGYGRLFYEQIHQFHSDYPY